MTLLIPGNISYRVCRELVVLFVCYRQTGRQTDKNFTPYNVIIVNSSLSLVFSPVLLSKGQLYCIYTIHDM